MGARIVEEFVALRPKMCSYLTDNGHVDKRTIARKKCAIKRVITFEDFKKCLENNRTILRTQQRCRIEAHIVFTKKVNKITLSANDDKRMQTPDGFLWLWVLSRIFRAHKNRKLNIIISFDEVTGENTQEHNPD